MDEIKTLATSVAALADYVQLSTGKMLVTDMAILALVKSHPDPAAFAAEFRRCWQLVGSQHSNDGNGPRVQAGIDEMLELLEEACPELNVRPPSV